jgi:hemolysin III
MTFLDPREPVSAISHGAGLLLSLPAMHLLWRQSHGDRAKQLSLLIYSLSMSACYAASTLFHAVRGPDSLVHAFRTFDHIGVFLYIAGSYTTVGWNVLRGRWRRCTLGLAWLWAVAGGILKLSGCRLSPSLSTGFYLAMGWGLSFSYFELARLVSHRTLRPVLAGGFLYSVGVAVKLLEWPNLWPNVVGPHEVFHLFVLAGSLVHFAFITKVVVPYEPELDAVDRTWRPAFPPRLALGNRRWALALNAVAIARPQASASTCKRL